MTHQTPASPWFCTVHWQSLCLQISVSAVLWFSHFYNICSTVKKIKNKKRGSIVADCFTAMTDARICGVNLASSISQQVQNVMRYRLLPEYYNEHTLWSWIWFYVQAFKAINRLFNPVFNALSPEGNDTVKTYHYSPAMALQHFTHNNEFNELHCSDFRNRFYGARQS